jgi:outer membrane protein assembly factor BamD (BamD/ComL family)
LGVAYYYLDNFDFANQELSVYLSTPGSTTFFEDAVRYKFFVAEAFRFGAKQRIIQWKQCPRWASGYTLALTIYDEIITTLPNHDLAAQALFSKGSLLKYLQEYRESIDAFQTLIRRFPKHELAPESYLIITQVYIEQAQFEFQNPDILDLAKINLKRFKEDFPREERLNKAHEDVFALEEVYANGLYTTGLFYEKKCRPRASVIYYQKAIVDFPNTLTAQLCRERLNALQRYL